MLSAPKLVSCVYLWVSSDLVTVCVLGEKEKGEITLPHWFKMFASSECIYTVEEIAFAQSKHIVCGCVWGEIVLYMNMCV